MSELLDRTMSIISKDIVPIKDVRANLTGLARQVREGSEKIITKNGESYVALIDVRRLDYYHQLEREHIHLVLLGEAERGWEDVEAGRLRNVKDVEARFRKHP